MFGSSREKFLPFFFLIYIKGFSFPEMTTKLNQEMYAKKNEPLSNLEKRVVRVVEKGTRVTPVTSILEATRVASPTTSVEEITPRPKKQ